MKVYIGQQGLKLIIEHLHICIIEADVILDIPALVQQVAQ